MRISLVSFYTLLALSSPAALGGLGQTIDNYESGFDDEFSEESFDFYGGADFVSIATGTKKALAKAPAIASVITEEDFHRIGATNLTQALSLIPGLHVSRNSQIMSPKFVFRGITSTYGPQTLLMVDGIPLKSTVRGDSHIPWGAYPLSAISRIEVIRGPGSALYGADAFAGVINIITKGAEVDNKVGVNIGSFATHGAFLNAGFLSGDWQVSFNFDYQQSDGHKEQIQQDAQFPLDVLAGELAGLPPVSHAPGPVNVQYEVAEALAKVSYKGFSGKMHLQQHNDIGTGQGVTEALDPNGSISTEKLVIAASYETDNKTSHWQHKISGSYYHSNQEANNITLFPAGTFFGAFPDGLIGNPSWQEQTSSIEYKSDYSGNQKHLFTIGVGYTFQDLHEVTESKNFFPDLTPRPDGVVDVSDSPEIFMPEANRDNSYIYLQDIWQVAPDWELTSGLRFDKYSDFGSTLNPRLALVWSKSLKSTIKFLYGQAFRAPTFAELLTVNNPVSLGNPNITPEKIKTLEASYLYRHDDHHTSSINFFHYQIDDFITFVPDAGAPTSTAQNVGERSGFGVEIESQIRISEQIELSGSYAFVRAKDDVLRDDVGDYPNHTVQGDIDWTISEALSFNTAINFVGTRKRTPLDTRGDLDSYMDVWLTLTFQPKQSQWQSQLSVKNALNDDIREPSSGPSTLGGPVNIPLDLPQAGRSVLWNISYTF